MSASAVIKPIFETKATEYKTNIYTPLLSVSVKNVLLFGSMDASTFPKSMYGGFDAYSSTSAAI